MSTTDPPPFYKTNVRHNDLQNGATNKFGKNIEYKAMYRSNYSSVGTLYM
jgi:hypothetical protein